MLAIEGLIRELSADDWQTRQKAQDALVQYGLDIRPRLSIVLRETHDEEARTRIEAALRQIEENRTTGASLDHASHESRKPSEVFAESHARPARSFARLGGFHVKRDQRCARWCDFPQSGEVRLRCGCGPLHREFSRSTMLSRGRMSRPYCTRASWLFGAFASRRRELANQPLDASIGDGGLRCRKQWREAWWGRVVCARQTPARINRKRAGNGSVGHSSPLISAPCSSHRGSALIQYRSGDEEHLLITAMESWPHQHRQGGLDGVIRAANAAARICVLKAVVIVDGANVANDLHPLFGLSSNRPMTRADKRRPRLATIRA